MTTSAKKLSSQEAIVTLRGNAHTCFLRTLAGMLFATICPVCVSSDYSVEDIAAALSEGAYALPNLRVEYTDTRVDSNGVPRLLVESVYAEKLLTKGGQRQRLRYQRVKASIIDANGQAIPHNDTLSGYNGQASIYVDHMSDPIEGYVRPGYDPNFFHTFYMDPHTKIWYFAAMPLGQFILRYRDGFEIKGQELLDDVSTIKLVGSWTDPYNGVDFTMNLWVAPERNFLPLKSEVMYTHGRMLTQIVCRDLVQLPNGHWYPKEIQIPGDDFPRSPHTVHIYHISRISIDPIPEEFFTPDFPPDIRVYDEILGIRYRTY
jgi:hypothetical protein